MRDVRVGCSGWNYEHWRELIYPKGLPPKKWLDHYATMFDTVEVNSTFYRLPRETAVANWVAQSPPGFMLAIKMSRYVTHVRRLQGVAESIGVFYERIAPLVRSPKLGPILWQFPETFRRNDERLAGALDVLPPGRHCFEFRHESWFVEDVYALLRAKEAALVIGDHPGRKFQPHELTTDWTFVRFHYGWRGRNGNYSDRELDEWADRIARWRPTIDVYAYFNNDWLGYAVDNGQGLKRRLGLT